MRRGHEVTVFGIADAEPLYRHQHLRFVPLAAREYPPGTFASALRGMRERQGLGATLLAIEAANRILRLQLEHAPSALKAERIDAVLTDQNEPALASVAEHLGIPFANLCTSLPINRERLVPPTFTNWKYSASSLAGVRNQLGYAVTDFFIRNLQATLNEYRSKWQLMPLHSPDDSLSTLAQVAQIPLEFDFPRQARPESLYYTGPWVDETAESATSRSSFPFEKLDGRPILYASLGTLQSSSSSQFGVIADACSGLDLQVIISVGASEGAALPQLPGNHLVVRFAPQTTLLRNTALTITHAGMNTTLQALHFGSPLIAIPISYDQPAIAARLKRTGAGIVLSPRQMTTKALRNAADAILKGESSWRTQAKRMQIASRNSGGVARAADIVEQTFRASHVRSASV